MAYPIQTIGELGAELGAPTPAEDAPAPVIRPAYAFWGALSFISMALCTWHGYRRNQSVGWAIVWGLAGAVLPVISVVIAAAQGFGERRRRKNPGRRSKRARLARARRRRRR